MHGDTRSQIRVAIVEDDGHVREAMRDFCNTQPNLSCTLAVECAEALWARLRPETMPDVILMDIGLPGMSGISAISLVRERYPDIDVIMLTVYHDPHKVFQSLCAGASGYLLKTTPFAMIREAIELVRNGGAAMSPQIARKVIDYFHPGVQNRGETCPLTAREREVVLALVEGLSYKLIAEQMNVSLDTVRSHIKSIYRKLHVHGKAEVIGRSLRGEI